MRETGSPVAGEGGGRTRGSPARRVDEACDRFEADWRAGRAPRIEDVLAAAADADRPDLVRELVALEIELRVVAGDRPEPPEYRARFPAYAGAVDSAFGVARTPVPGRDPDPDPDRTRIRDDRDAGHNLLLGVLALQNNFVSRDELLAAFNAWVADKTRSLGRRLLERGALDAARLALLEALVDEHLGRHGGDAERSLAALDPADPFASVLARAGDADVRSLLTRVETVRVSGGVGVGAGPSAGAGTRYRIVRPHATGGLGEVFVARDLELNREVALKQIRATHAHDPDSRARFLLEAEVAGGLEHPGIVPVYGLGMHPDGRPYYAMRFIRGDSLRDAIRVFHQAERPGRDPGERTLALRGLLGRFVDVCDAVAYAHSRGVLHRDIKPANVMLGPYGETLVVDWGLAKVVGRPDVAGRGAGAESALRPRSSGDGSGATRAGDAIGTPSYMSPEQAEGALDRLGAAADVYSLGATLYSVLTGRAPFKDDADPDRMLWAVKRGDFPPPRAVKPDAPPALESVCLKAMALRPDDRYPNADALARDVERWLADEPVSAHADGPARRLARWARRNRAWVGAGVAALLAVAVVASAAALAVSAAWRKAEDALAAESRAKADAESNYQTARRAVQESFNRVSNNPLLKRQDRADLRALRKDLLDGALAYYTRFIATHRDDPRLQAELADAYFRAGQVTAEIGSKEEALRRFERGRDLCEALLRARPGDPETRAALAPRYLSIGGLQYDTGQTDQALASYRRAGDEFRRLEADGPLPPALRGGLAQSELNAGVVLAATAKTAEALDSFRRARAAFRALVDADPTSVEARVGLANSAHGVGTVLDSTGRPAEAVEAHGEARAIFAALAREDPASAELCSPAARTYLGGDALPALERACADFQKLADANPTVTPYQRDLGAHLLSLASLQATTAPPEAALETYRRARAVFLRLAAADPAVVEPRNRLAECDLRIADLQNTLDRPAEAIEALESAREAFRSLADAAPTITEYRAGLAESCRSLALLHRAAGRPAEALQAFASECTILEGLAEAATSVADHRNRLAVCLRNLASVQSAAASPAAARASLGRAAAIARALADASPSVPGYRRHLAVILLNLGEEEAAAGPTNRADALASFEQARAALEGLARDDPNSSDLAGLLARCHHALGALHGDPARARRSFEAALAASESIADPIPADLFLRARTLARLAALAGPGPAAESLAARAVDSLRQAAASPGFDSDALARARDLAPLRSRPDFHLLMLDLAVPARPFEP